MRGVVVASMQRPETHQSDVASTNWVKYSAILSCRFVLRTLCKHLSRNSTALSVLVLCLESQHSIFVSFWGREGGGQQSSHLKWDSSLNLKRVALRRFRVLPPLSFWIGFGRSRRDGPKGHLSPKPPFHACLLVKVEKSKRRNRGSNKDVTRTSKRRMKRNLLLPFASCLVVDAWRLTWEFCSSAYRVMRCLTSTWANSMFSGCDAGRAP